MRQQQQQRRTIDKSELGKVLEQTLCPLGEHQREMQQERWGKQPCHNAGPIDFIIERIELSAVVKAVENERHQAEDVEVNGARRVPPADENKNSNEKVDQADNAKIIF